MRLTLLLVLLYVFHTRFATDGNQIESITGEENSEDASVATENQDTHMRVCVEDNDIKGTLSYVCTTRGDQLKMESERSQRYNLGVIQRIDGSDEEKEGIREVISLMKEYFYTEVLAKPAYRDIRHKCQNFYELCAFWASLGECETNRKFMVPHCAATCRLCLLHNSGIGERIGERAVPLP